MIPDITPVNTWAGNGSNITFDFDFLINKESELQVLHTSKDGIQTELQLNKDYTIYQIGNENGSYITFPILGSSYSVLSDDEKISLVLNIPKAQTSPYGTSSKLNLTALEHSLDYIVRLIQMVDRKADRAVKVQEGSDISPEKLINSLKQSEINSRDYAQTAIDKALDAEESAQTAKEQADIATQKTQEVADLYDGAIVDITQRHNTAINEINKLHESVNIDIDSINTVKEEALNNVIAEGQNQIELIKEQGSSYATKEDAKYTAGNGIDITDNIISNTQTSAEWGNITGNIENQEDLVNYVKKYSGGLEVCDIGMSLYIDETKGLRRWLNGQIVDINANTQAFLDRLKQIVALYPSLSCTEEEWQSIKSASAFGQVGKFVFNYNPELIIEVVSVRIPAVVNVQGLLDLQNLGMTVEAGLPNITGTLGVYNNLPPVDGAFYHGTTANSSVGYSESVHADWAGQKFNASLSNPIYGATDTVQEEAIQYPYYIQIATGQETEVNIRNDIESIVPYTLFDSKYSEAKQYNASWVLGGSTLSKSVYPTAYEAALVEYNSEIADGTTVELPSGVSYTKRGVSGGITVKLSTDETVTEYDWKLDTVAETLTVPTLNGSEALLSDRYDDLELNASGSTYTAPANGWFWIQKLSSSTSQYLTPVIKDSNGNIKYTLTSQPTGVGYDAEILAPVSKGDVISIGYNVGGATKSFRFIYAKGNGSLYFFVASVAQNAPLANLGRIGEQLAQRKVVVETYKNGNSWYRVWSDGWCEQGGVFDRGSDITTGGSVVISLVHPFKDTHYTLMVNNGGNSTGNGFGWYVENNIMTARALSEFYVYTWKRETSNRYISWYACGY